MITINESNNSLPAIRQNDYNTFFQQEKIKFLNEVKWKKILESFWRETRLNVSPNDIDALVSFLRNKRDTILQAYKQCEFFIFWNRCFDNNTKQFDEAKFIRLLSVAYNDKIEKNELDDFFSWLCLTEYIDELLSKVIEHQKKYSGATINFFYNEGGEMNFGTPSKKKSKETTVEEEPLRNFIFKSQLFDSNNRLAKLRDTIAAAIDMGEATLMYGKPQEMRINPSVQSEWYYIVKALEEAKVTQNKMSVVSFIEQIMEWYPMLFSVVTKDEWIKLKRRLSKSISDEKSLWRQGKTKQVVTLREMWAKGINKILGSAKSERIYQIAYKGLYVNLVNLRTEIERENSER